MPNAPEPKKSSGKLTISFGLVSIPVSVYTGTEDIGVHRNRFSPAGNPVGILNIDKETGEPVPYDQIVTMYASGDGDEKRTVELTDDEIAAAAGGVKGLAEIVAVLPLSELGAYNQDGLMQVRPDVKANAGAARAFALLVTALETDEQFMLIRYTLRGKTRVAALTSDGFLRPVLFAGEVRAAREMPSDAVPAAELDMARQLLGLYAQDVAPVIEDEATAAVRAYAEAKLAGDAPAIAEPVRAPVGDLMDALRASVDAQQAAAKPAKRKAAKAS